MNEAKKIADVDAEWERMIQDHAEKLGLDINGGRLEAQGNSNSTRRPQSILRYEALKKHKRLINTYRKRGYSLRFIFDMLVSNGKIDYGYVTFWRYVQKFDKASAKQKDEDISESLPGDVQATLDDKFEKATSESEVSEARNSNVGSVEKQYPDNYVGFRFDPNPDKDNLI